LTKIKIKAQIKKRDAQTKVLLHLPSTLNFIPMSLHDDSTPVKPQLTLASDESVGDRVLQRNQGSVVPQGDTTPSTHKLPRVTHTIFSLEIFKKLSLLDKLLSPLIILVMIVGVVIGEFAPNVQEAFDTVRFDSVSVRKSTVSSCGNATLKMRLFDLSHCNWPHSYDVAHPNKSAIRKTTDSV
jgi:hypothetical protein